MAKPLLDRQVSLLAYLTSGAAILGKDGAAPADPALAGLDVRLLQLEARFSHEKRMEKIAGIFARTLELLGGDQARVVETFAQRCPSVSIGRIENARQFYAFLTGLWRFGKPGLPYLPDVTACELAFAEARNGDAGPSDARCRCDEPWFRVRLRRHPRAALQRCDHDVRSLFEADDLQSVPLARETFLAFAMPPAAAEVAVFELDPAIFTLLRALTDWTDRAAFGATADVLIDELLANGLLEADL
jgi:hypothetical protein